ncbi:CehA/McbA family metallohydrolase [Nakamurella aerolata]|nr:CehA/McbA family metallohydrolase [Nakamurella aerolata]
MADNPRVMSRRNVIAAGAAGAAATVANLLPGLAFAPQAEAAPTANPSAPPTQTKTVTGHLEPGNPDYYYVPVEVPAGVSRIDVSYSYNRPDVPPGRRGNACDIGMFGPEGLELGNRKAFRGWSGGARSEFFISPSEATPGYLAGPVGAGTWHVVLGAYTIAPSGMDFSVTVTLTFGRPTPPFRAIAAPTRAPRRERGRAWYRGDCHLHTVHSDGKRTPEQLVAAATAAKLDFITSTEHNTPSAQLVWGRYATDDLLILNGEEVTTRSGHWPAIGLPADTWIDWRYRADTPEEFRRFTDQVHAAGGLVTAAHPFANCFACAFEFPLDAGVDLIEVWNGPWTPEDDAAVTHWDGLLRTGTFLPAIGDSDAHAPADTVGLPQTVVYADKLERTALMQRLKQGRSYLVASAGLSLAAGAWAAGAAPASNSDGTAAELAGKPGVAGLGGRLAVDWGVEVTVRCRVSGFPAGAVATVFDQLGPQLHTPVDGPDQLVEWVTDARYTCWVRFEVRDAAGAMLALSNPIFVGK